MIPRSHPLASVGDAFNAVFVEAEAAGQLMFYGRGAGGAPTASAVLGDLVAVARNRLAGGARPGRRRPTPTCRSGRWARRSTRYHVSLDVADKPGVLAAVAQAFAAHGVCIETVRQDGRGDDASWSSSPTRAPGRGAGRDRRRELRGRCRVVRARRPACCGSEGIVDDRTTAWQPSRRTGRA